MTTRDIGSNQTPSQQPSAGRVETIDGVIYYHLIACDGWPTGPCKTVEKARERVRAYELCEEVSEAAPGQASRAQMQALRSFLERTSALIELDGVDSAIRAGLHSTEWIRMSARLASRYNIPEVVQAGGTLVRRRLPTTQIPSRGA